MCEAITFRRGDAFHDNTCSGHSSFMRSSFDRRTAALGGRTYDVWRDTSGWQYVAFVPTAVMTSGTIDVKEILEWMIGEGWITSSATLDQLCFGVEIVSTDGADATFTFTDFAISTAP